MKTSDQSGPISQGEEAISCLGKIISFFSCFFYQTSKQIQIKHWWNSALSSSSELLGLYMWEKKRERERDTDRLTVNRTAFERKKSFEREVKKNPPLSIK